MSRLQRLFAGMILLFIVASATTLMAQGSNTTFVSALKGRDTYPCSLITSPCRSLGRAIAVTAPGGKVVVIDSGEYGTFSITQSIQIDADGVYAGVTAASSDPGILVNAPAAVVVIRGLTINAVTTNTVGISVEGVGKLYVENCVINGFTASGIAYYAGYGSGSAGLLTVKDTIIRNGGFGIYVNASGSGNAAVTIDHVRLEGNSSIGLTNRSTITTTTIRDSVVTGSGIDGVSNAVPASGIAGLITVENCAVVNNATGIRVDNGAIILVSSTVISGNQFALDYVAGGGTITSFLNNRLGGNTSDGDGFTNSIKLQ